MPRTLHYYPSKLSSMYIRDKESEKVAEDPLKHGSKEEQDGSRKEEISSEN